MDIELNNSELESYEEEIEDNNDDEDFSGGEMEVEETKTNQEESEGTENNEESEENEENEDNEEIEDKESKQEDTQDMTSDFLERIANTNMQNEEKVYNHNNVLLGGSIEDHILENNVLFRKYSSKMLGLRGVSSKKMNDEFCCICYAEQRNKIEGVLNCGHAFCHDCILGWSKISSTCPYCKDCFKAIKKRIHSIFL